MNSFHRTVLHIISKIQNIFSHQHKPWNTAQIPPRFFTPCCQLGWCIPPNFQKFFRSFKEIRVSRHSPVPSQAAQIKRLITKSCIYLFGQIAVQLADTSNVADKLMRTPAGSRIYVFIKKHKQLFQGQVQGGPHYSTEGNGTESVVALFYGTTDRPLTYITGVFILCLYRTVLYRSVYGTEHC